MVCPLTNSFPLTLSWPGAFIVVLRTELPVLPLMPRRNGVCHQERLRSCSAVSGWTPELCCSWTSQDGALRCACRIAWTAIWVLLDVALCCSLDSRKNPSCLESARGAS